MDHGKKVFAALVEGVLREEASRHIRVDDPITFIKGLAFGLAIGAGFVFSFFVLK